MDRVRFRNPSNGWFAIVGGLAIAAIALFFGLRPDYGWAYAVWFGWVSPILVALGVAELLPRKRAGKERGGASG